MFSSHILTAQDIVQYVLRDEETVAELRVLADQNDSDSTSSQICKLILSAKAAEAEQTTSFESEASTAQGSSGNLNTLIRNFRMMMADARDEEQNERYKCPFCTSDPVPAIITSCRHLYCEECFNALPDKDGNTNNTSSRVCCSCKVQIEDAAIWSDFDKITRFRGNVPTSLATPRKRRLNSTARRTSAANPGFPRWKKAFGASKRTRGNGTTFSSSTNSVDHAEDDYETDAEDFIRDWIPLIGSSMPAAKLTKIREITKKWIHEDAKVKIVIFVFFLGSVELLQMMCKQEGWPHTKVRTNIPSGFCFAFNVLISYSSKER